MEGIETMVLIIVRQAGTGVSRCPDMEGIETRRAGLRRHHYAVSVGAPTWRGLKRAKKPNQKRLQSVRVSRCPDMEGIET